MNSLMCLMVCRVENSEANRMKGLPDVAVITCQLRQEVQLTHARKSNASFRCHLAQLTHARKSNASFRCHLAQMQLCKLLNEARLVSRDMLCGIYGIVSC